MPRFLSLTACATALVCSTASFTAVAQQAYPATLAGHAVLPAQSVIAASQDAPQDLQVAAKFTTPRRVEAVGTVMGQSAGRDTGISLPFKGQPVQGHSGIKRMADGSFWILTDNGAGAKANSPDFMLYLNHYTVDFQSGQFNRQKTVFLHDPRVKVDRMIADDPAAELERLENALDQLRESVDAMLESSELALAGETREVIDAADLDQLEPPSSQTLMPPPRWSRQRRCCRLW